jgi:hypothetical protein
MSLEQTQRNQNSDRDASSTNTQYRLRFQFGEISLYSAWHAELAPVENLGVQLIQGSEFHDITIERRTEVGL